ncbi:MAG: UDP-N-acetylmuramoyl-L-alanine--D-glutamate ligase [Candidatus Aminicenantes bacterium]|nr:UDP-N-acetylmuramoyl-L-alanine--D-glutamate ligase [Candidatus Aminicenantes bacterium]
MELKDRTGLVIGMGKTGEAVCDFLIRSGSRLIISDSRTAAVLGESYTRWKDRAIFFETGGHSEQILNEADFVISSPGIPDIPLFEAARKRSLPVLSEIELAARFLKGRIIGITGSNGKSTTTTLTHKILKDGGLQSHLAGNIGTPLIRFALDSREEDLYVTELSSFQLNNIDHFKAAMAVFLNVAPDHIDWHRNFASYLDAKKNLIRSQDRTGIAVLNRDDPLVWETAAEAKGSVHAFSRRPNTNASVFLRGEDILFALGHEEFLMPVDDIPLLGEHNLENVMAAALVSRLCGLLPAGIRTSIQSFDGLEHRLKKVTEIEGITFYNDSKATNVDASSKAIRSFDQKIVLILGGRDKAGDFTQLIGDIRAQVKTVVLMGEAADKIRNVLTGIVPLRQASDMKEAVLLAHASASSGDVVLLAPACTSWDMYNNFEERGEDFKQQVFSLGAEKKGRK